MNENIRYPLMLLVSLVGIAFSNFANASSIQPSGHYQQNYFPVTAAYNPDRVTSRYRFRPVSSRGVTSPYRLPAARYFGGYHGMVMAPPYAYSPQLQPARSYTPRLAGRNAWKSAEYTFPRAGYLRPNYFRYPAHPPQSWGGLSTPSVTNYYFIQRGYNQSRMPAGFGTAWAGRQAGYFGRFRPLSASRPVPAEVAAAWRWQPPAYQRPFRQPHSAPVFPARAEWAPVDLAYSAPMFKGWRKMADNRHYRFRPDSRLVDSQEAARAMDSGSPFPEGMYDRFTPSASSAGYRFRPDNRLSRSFPAAHRQLLPVFATSPEQEVTGQLFDGLSESSATGLHSSSLGILDSADAVDLYEYSVLDPVRRMRILGVKSIADNLGPVNTNRIATAGGPFFD